MKEFFGYDLAGVTLLDPRGENPTRTYMGVANQIW